MVNMKNADWSARERESAKLEFKTTRMRIGWDEDQHPTQDFIGCRVAVRWIRSRRRLVMYMGTIISFDNRTQRHTVQYDDGETRPYDLKTRRMLWMCDMSAATQACFANTKEPVPWAATMAPLGPQVPLRPWVW